MADAATSVRIQSDPSRVNVRMVSVWLRIRDLALVRRADFHTEPGLYSTKFAYSFGGFLFLNKSTAVSFTGRERLIRTRLIRSPT